MDMTIRQHIINNFKGDDYETLRKAIDETTRQNSQNPQTSNARHNRNDSLLRDLIKILIIKELLSRNHFQRQYRK